MGKNIVMFADGTGNKGGTTPDSNVYKMYHSLDFHSQSPQQIAFYDNGVGTASNRFKKAIGGALGFGFKHNVKDQYEFLAKHYEPGDRIYFFGFSRGAATVRSCVGFLTTCGIIDGHNLAPTALREHVDRAFSRYASIRRKQGQEKEEKVVQWLSEAKQQNLSISFPDVHFLGVWDTVAALGFPKRIDVKSPVSLLLEKLFETCDWILDRVFQHRFYAYDLSNSIKHAYQALSIDDARKTFWPLVWNEQGFQGEVEQVWFAGVHSNVGGGYERQGLANVSLHWLMIRAEKLGLVFRDGSAEATADSANPHGHLYDSRSGLGMFYRYFPRDIGALNEKQLISPIKIHQSVLERINMRTAEYAPYVLPRKFDATATQLSGKTAVGDVVGHYDLGEVTGYEEQSNELQSYVNTGIGLYTLFIWSLVLSAGIPLLLGRIHKWEEGSETQPFEGVAGLIDDYLHENLDPLIKVFVQDLPILGGALAMFYVLLFWVNQRSGENTKLTAWSIGQMVQQAELKKVKPEVSENT